MNMRIAKKVACGFVIFDRKYPRKTQEKAMWRWYWQRFARRRGVALHAWIKPITPMVIDA